MTRNRPFLVVILLLLLCTVEVFLFRFLGCVSLKKKKEKKVERKEVDNKTTPFSVYGNDTVFYDVNADGLFSPAGSPTRRMIGGFVPVAFLGFGWSLNIQVISPPLLHFAFCIWRRVE